MDKIDKKVLITFTAEFAAIGLISALEYIALERLGDFLDRLLR